MSLGGELALRKIALVLVGLGAFLLVLGLLVRFYAYPALARVPLETNTVTTLVGPGATIFDKGSLKEITTDLTTKVITLGDVAAAKAEGHDTVVYISKSSTRSGDGVIRARSVEREAFNAVSALAVNCCGEFVEDTQGQQVPVKHEGLLVKFPFNTQKHDYNFWDGTLNKAVPATYQGTVQVNGVTAYHFVQTIPRTQVGTLEVPASILGLKAKGNVTADQMYANVRTLDVEPNTGVILKRIEQQDSTLAYGGSDRVTLTKVSTGYDDATVKKNTDEYGPKGSQLALLRGTLPWILGIIGVLCIGVGALLRLRPARTDQTGA